MIRPIVSRRSSLFSIVEEVGQVELVVAQVGMGFDAVKNHEHHKYSGCELLRPSLNEVEGYRKRVEL